MQRNLQTGFAVLALALATAAAGSAQGPDNGRAGRGECDTSPGLPPNGEWHCFDWGLDAAEGPVIATPVFTTGPGQIDVTDCGCAGDAFQVRVDGVVIGGTPSVPPDGNCERGQTLDQCFGDPAFSHATFTLGPGQHSVQIEVVDNPFNSGSGGIRARRVIQAIPTLSQLGLATFLLAMLGASLVILRRRRAV